MCARSVFSSLLLIACAHATLPAQEFRIETEVIVDGSKKPIDSLTLFMGDVIYDFLLTPNEETTIFDIRRGKLVLLDSTRQIKTSLTTEELAEFSAAIKVLGSQKGPVGLLQPKFETDFDAEQQRLTLSSEWLTYKAKGVPSKHADGAQRYRQFADWYARLNAIRPQNPPPFGRLELNQALAERGLIPQEIERTIVLDGAIARKTSQVKSKHTIVWSLSNTDRGRIEKAGKNLVSFEEVPPNKYWGVTEKTAQR